MEGAGTESVSQHITIFQTADGGACWDAHIHRYMVHTVLLLPMVGSDDALRMVAAIAVPVETDLRRFCKMGLVTAYSRCYTFADKRRHWLLDLCSETAWTLFPHNHRDYSRSDFALGIPLTAGQILATGYMDGADMHCRLSTDGHLRFGSNPTDGHLVLATGKRCWCCRQ